MKKLFFAGSLICLALSASSCSNSNADADCILGKWAFSSPSTNAVPSCLTTIEFNPNNKGSVTLDDCSNFCSNSTPMNYYTFTYTANNGSVHLKIDGKIKICGADYGESNTESTGSYVCVDQNTLKLTSLASGSQPATLTRVQ